ncbi:hypothetical protein [uncultured Mediterranean phage uvMED]|nr:hypothetical protein [uncultured Mediterranean phage uvMED]
MKNSWFEIDKKGLQQIQNDKNKFFIIKELVSNSFDEDINRCVLTLDFDKDKELFVNVLDDSKDGFKDLKDSYTMFAPSYKKGIATKRGRFNVGEKFALSMFRTACITSTTGRVTFLEDGTRKKTYTKIDKGTLFMGKLPKINKSQYEDLINQSQNIIPPKDVEFLVNGKVIDRLPTYKSFIEELPSITKDDEGNLVKTKRKTEIELFKTDVHFIYEMGIPVVSTDIGFSINVNQKIPLSKDRDNVNPSYLKKLKTYILNHTSSDLSEEETKSSWVQEALENADTHAVKDVIDVRYGDDAVVFDVTDHEANKKAFADDKNVITGGSFNSQVWDNIRKTRDDYEDFAKPSGSIGKYASPNMSGTRPAELLDKSKITKEMKQVISLAKKLHKQLFNQELNVEIFNEKGLGGNRLLATYCKGYSGSDLSFYYKTLGKDWFNLQNNKVKIIELIIHEFGHFYSGDHLSERYYDGLCEIGAKLYCKEF